MGRKSREKGKVGEREVANILKKNGFDTKRGMQYHGGPDSPDVTGLPGVHIEVKRVENFRLYDAMAQSKRDAGDGEMPVVWHRKNRERWVVVMDYEDFISMYRKANLDTL